MKAAAFEYTRPESLQDALRALRAHEGRAKLMAGGQSLGPMLNLRLARPPVVIDISGLSELRTVTRQDGKLRVGAAVTHAEIEDGVHELLRGTLGGSLAHADPAADWVLTVVGLGATLEIAGPAGVRMLPAEDYMQGAYTTGLREDELISAVHIPEAGPQARWGYYKFCRKTGEFAEASCAAWFDPAAKTARIAVGALDGAPRLLPQLAARIAQQGLAGLDETLLANELAGVMQDKDEHHRKLHGTAVTRCLAQALG